jgi:hypothetical protein
MNKVASDEQWFWALTIPAKSKLEKRSTSKPGPPVQTRSARCADLVTKCTANLASRELYHHNAALSCVCCNRELRLTVRQISFVLPSFDFIQRNKVSHENANVFTLRFRIIEWHFKKPIDDLDRPYRAS